MQGITKLTLLFALFGLAVQSCVGSVVAEFGVSADVSANTETKLKFGAGIANLHVTLTIETDVAAKVTLKQATTVTNSLPRGYNSLSVGGASQYELIVTAAAGSGAVGLTKAVLSTPDLAASLAAVTNLEVGCVRFDSETEAYTAVDGVQVVEDTVLNTRVEVTLPKTGVYVIASFAATVPLPTLYAEVRVTSSSESRSYQYAGDLEVTVKTSTDNNELTVRKKAAADATAALEASTKVAGKAAVVAGGVFDIGLKTEESVEAEIKFVLSADVAADIDVSSVIVAFYNTTAKAWTQASGKLTVDAEARVVTQASTHFSEWAMFADGKDGSGGSSDAATHGSVFLSAGALVGTMFYLL